MSSNPFAKYAAPAGDNPFTKYQQGGQNPFAKYAQPQQPATTPSAASGPEPTVRTPGVLQTASGLPAALREGVTQLGERGLRNVGDFAREYGGQAAESFKAAGRTVAHIAAGAADVSSYLPVGYAIDKIRGAVGAEPLGDAYRAVARNNYAPTRQVDPIVETGTPLAINLGAGHLAGPIGGAAVFSAAAESQAREAGATPMQALGQGAVDAATAYATGKLAGVGPFKFTGEVGKDVARSVTRNALQGGLQTTASNVYAANTYDPKRSYLEGVPESVLTGALTSGFDIPAIQQAKAGRPARLEQQRLLEAERMNQASAPFELGLAREEALRTQAAREAENFRARQQAEAQAYPATPFNPAEILGKPLDPVAAQMSADIIRQRAAMNDRPLPTESQYGEVGSKGKASIASTTAKADLSEPTPGAVERAKEIETARQVAAGEEAASQNTVLNAGKSVVGGQAQSLESFYPAELQKMYKPFEGDSPNQPIPSTAETGKAGESGRQVVPDGVRKPHDMSSQEFYRDYWQHNVLSEGTPTDLVDRIKSEGWKPGVGPNVVSATRGKPASVIEKTYGTKAGRPVIATPNSALVKNQPKIKPGWKFDGGVLVTPISDFEPLHHAIVREALDRGEYVSPKVLAEYPDLASQQGRQVAPPAEPGPQDVTMPMYSGPNLEPVVKGVGKAAGVVADASNYWSRPLSENLEAIAPEGKAGDNARKYAALGPEHADLFKKISGKYEPEVDAARQTATRLSAFTNWMNKAVRPDGLGEPNWVAAAEGRIPVPERFASDWAKIDAGNRAGAKIAAESGQPVAGEQGKVQRFLTPVGMEAITNPGSPERASAVKLYSEMNGKPPEAATKFLNELKADIDAGDYVGAQRKMSAEARRGWDQVPSIIQTKSGPQWMFHHQAADYFEIMPKRNAARAAYLKLTGGAENARAMEAAAKAEVGRAESVDELTRAMHEIPKPGPLSGTMSPTGTMGGVTRAVKNALNVASAAATSFTHVGNATELAMGAASREGGLNTTIRAIKRMQGERAAELALGATNKALYNWSIDPTRPAETMTRMIANGLRKAGGSNFWNEATESLAATVAKVMTEDAQAGKFTGSKKSEQYAIYRQSGFDAPTATAMVEGRGTPEQYARFERNYAASRTGGNKTMAEGSQFSNSRTAQALLKFQNYPITQFNLLRKAGLGISEGIKTGDRAQLVGNVRLLAKHAAGLTVAGAVQKVIMDVLTSGGDLTKAKNTIAEATASPTDAAWFLTGSFFRGLGGPYSILNELLTGQGSQGSGAKNMVTAAADKLFPLRAAMEFYDALTETGRYEGMGIGERAGNYVMNNTPGLRVANRWFSTLALGKDFSLQEGARIARRWKAENNMGGGIGEGPTDADSIAFRKAMRDIANQVTTSDKWDIGNLLADALKVKIDKTQDYDKAMQSVASSLRGKMVMRGLKPEDQEKMRRKIGDDAYNKAVKYDALLDALADSLN